jgi:hypothetical protein
MERQAITDISNEVRHKHLRSVQVANNRSVLFMEPSCYRREIPSDKPLDGQLATPRAVTWVCLPYFSLELYSRLDTSPDFAAQTLLQSHYTRVARARDMQQAVCQEAPEGHCYHIAQLWCLVVADGVFPCFCTPMRQGLYMVWLTRQSCTVYVLCDACHGSLRQDCPDSSMGSGRGVCRGRLAVQNNGQLSRNRHVVHFT